MIILSKLYNTYLTLKKQDSETIYLFKSGIFFLAIDKDAYILSDIFNFKLGNLNDIVVKCGFPCSSFDKYSKLFKLHNLNIKIIELEDNNTLYRINEYVQNQTTKELLNYINSVDINNLSIPEAYQWIADVKSKANKINNNGAIK